MPKRKSSPSHRSKSKPQKWPKSGKLASWLERYLDVLEQGKNPARTAGKARVPLRQLAELGSEAKALKRLDRLCELSSSEVGTWVRLSLVGAEISLENLKLKRADKYLASIQDRLPKAPASKRGFLASLVQSFCAINGLDDHLDFDEFDEDEHYEALQVGKCRQQYRLAFLDGDLKKALAANKRFAKLIPDIDDFVLERTLILSAIKAFGRIGNEDDIVKYVNGIDRSGHGRDLDTGALWAMGLKEVANQRAEKLVGRLRKKLKTDDDSNIHFPVDEICEQFWFFLKTSNAPAALPMLKQTLREMPKWPGLSGGFSAAACWLTPPTLPPKSPIVVSRRAHKRMPIKCLRLRDVQPQSRKRLPSRPERKGDGNSRNYALKLATGDKSPNN